MHIHNLDHFRHQHLFDDPAVGTGERRTNLVVLLASITMVVEIAGGWIFNSMALLADGWHMASHVAALGITLFAYRFARRHAHDRRFTFGTGKVGILGGFASAVVLGMVALLMAGESVWRLAEPRPIAFDQAVAVAILGLVVNLVSARLLHADGEGHDHDHGHDSDHGSHSHHDHNLRAAYLHVVADALTSVLALLALTAGKFWGWLWMDAAVGLVGAGVIGKWSLDLIRDTGRVLLDGAAGETREAAIRSAIEADADNRVVDVHAWHVGSGRLAAVVSIVTHHPRTPDHYKALLASQQDLVHLTIEVHPGPGEPCLPVGSG